MKKLLVLVFLISCQGDATPTDPGPPAQTATLVAGETTFTTDVWTASSGERHYKTTGVELGQVVVLVDGVRATGSPTLRLDVQQFFEGTPFSDTLELALPLETEDLDKITTAIAYKHKMTAGARRALLTGVVEQDKPGCDFPEIFHATCGGGGACCDMHDKCYADHGCTSASWLSTDGDCQVCNAAVTACIAGTSYAQYIGFAFPYPWGPIIGMVAGWLVRQHVGQSDCCDMPGPGGTEICHSDSCDVGWYNWGNHSCHTGYDTMLNIYCMAQPYWLPNGAGPYYFFQGCYKYDARSNTNYRLPDSQIECDPNDDDGYCNDQFYCAACNIAPGTNPGCNPPFFSPGSLMDRVCNQDIPSGTPIPPGTPIPSVPSCGESGGNTCDNDLSDGSACGPEYNLLTAYDCVHCCNKPQPTCGDGVCSNETCETCPADCGGCAPACDWTDCQGTCNGGVWNDACGVCGGDGSSCAPSCDWYDCTNTCNGGTWNDGCGVCGGDGSSCGGG